MNLRTGSISIVLATISFALTLFTVMCNPNTAGAAQHHVMMISFWTIFAGTFNCASG